MWQRGELGLLENVYISSKDAWLATTDESILKFPAKENKLNADTLL